MKTVLIIAATLFAVGSAAAGEARILDVTSQPTGKGVYRFSVTLAHADSGWDHYADRWEILTDDGTVLATRVLHHPHVHEQPFTRSLDNVRLPTAANRVLIRAHDSVHGYSNPPLVFDIVH